MTIYLDANVLVALFTQDALSGRADAFVQANPSILIVSDLAAAEFASAIGRLVRMAQSTPSEARIAFSDFDAWTARASQRVETIPADIAAADAFLRRLDLTLRTPDALNVAIAQRVGATLATFDAKLAADARILGVPVAIP